MKDVLLESYLVHSTEVWLLINICITFHTSSLMQQDQPSPMFFGGYVIVLVVLVSNNKLHLQYSCRSELEATKNTCFNVEPEMYPTDFDKFEILGKN